jgi:hypothetical protein
MCRHRDLPQNAAVVPPPKLSPKKFSSKNVSYERSIAAVHGSEAELLVLERRFATGDVEIRQFAAAIHALWTGLSPAMVASAFAGSAWLTGIAEVCADIRDRGEHSAVITMSPDFFADHLVKYGVATRTTSSIWPRTPATPARSGSTSS